MAKMMQDQRMFNGSKLFDISIPLRFNGPQPNAFGAMRAKAELLGDTRNGSSVNYSEYVFVPHCNGTHTECVGHITDERLSIRDCLKDTLMRAFLLSVDPVTSENGDSVITFASLEAAVDALKGSADGHSPLSEDLPMALIIRTLPNDDSKLAREYTADAQNAPPYFTSEAMRFVVDCGVEHLLVDMPSIDPMSDGGKLVNHRIFWNVEEGSREINTDSRINSTITEMIYVPDHIEDGEYILNLQIAPFDTDAAPSRPVLLK